MNNSAIIYCRTSTLRQDTSIEVQRERCTLLCQLRGLDVREVITDHGFSGKDIDRPGFQRLMKEVKENTPQYLVVFRLDRLSRSVSDITIFGELLSTKNVQLISVNENIDTSTVSGRMMMSMLLVLNQFERETIIARVRESLSHRKVAGKKYTRITPYGKILTNGMYVDCPHEVQIINQVKLLRLSGFSLRGIAKWLNENGIQTRNGNPWIVSSIQKICLKPQTSSPIPI